MTRTATNPRCRPLPCRALTLLVLAFAAGCGVSHATDDHPHEAIAAAAVEYMHTAAQAAHGSARVEVVPGRLDPRLALARCPEALETFLPPGGRLLGRTVAGVRCPAATRWSLFVPVTVEVYREVVTLARPLARGTRLGAGDLALEAHDLGTLPRGYLVDPAQAIDRELRRSADFGSVLTPMLLTEPQVITRGQRVRLESGNGTIGVLAEAEALGHAARGQAVRVRNLSSGEVIRALAIDDGLVAVGPGAAERARNHSSSAGDGR